MYCYIFICMHLYVWLKCVIHVQWTGILLETEGRVQNSQQYQHDSLSYISIPTRAIYWNLTRSTLQFIRNETEGKSAK